MCVVRRKCKFWTWNPKTPIYAHLRRLSIGSGCLNGHCRGYEHSSRKHTVKTNIYKLKTFCLYLTPLLLPEDSRLWISFGFTWKCGITVLCHNLVSWANDKLRWSYNYRNQETWSYGERYRVQQQLRAKDLQAKAGNISHGQIKMGVFHRAAMQFSLS